MCLLTGIDRSLCPIEFATVISWGELEIVRRGGDCEAGQRHQLNPNAKLNRPTLKRQRKSRSELKLLLGGFMLGLTLK